VQDVERPGNGSAPNLSRTDHNERDPAMVWANALPCSEPFLHRLDWKGEAMHRATAASVMCALSLGGFSMQTVAKRSNPSGSSSTSWVSLRVQESFVQPAHVWNLYEGGVHEAIVKQLRPSKGGMGDGPPTLLPTNRNCTLDLLIDSLEDNGQKKGCVLGAMCGPSKFNDTAPAEVTQQ
jgi:hypothetical protein